MAIQSINIPTIVLEPGRTNVSREIKKAVPANDQVPEPIQSSGSAPQNKIEYLVDKVTELSRNLNIKLSFSIDEELNMVIVTITRPGIEPGSELEVIRQIPPEEMVEFARRFKELNDGGETEVFIPGLKV